MNDLARIQARIVELQQLAAPVRDGDPAAELLRRDRIERLRREARIPARFANASITSLLSASPRAMQFATRAIAAVREQRCDSVRIGLHGSAVGVGKTHLAAAIVSAAVEAGVAARFATASSLVDELHDASRYSSAGGVGEMMGDLTRVPVLAIDDLGRESVTRRSLPWLNELLNRRWAEGRGLIVTSNYGFAALAQRYAAHAEKCGEDAAFSNALTDRLRGLVPIGNWVEMTGASRR